MPAAWQLEVAASKARSLPSEWRVSPLRGCFAKTLPYFTEALKRGAAFFWERKRWWLVPMVVVMVSFGVIVLLSESAAPARFIYAGF